MDEFESLVDFFVETNKLKNTMRYSSCPENIRESTAGHSWKMALMVPLIAEKLNLKIDVSHAMELALVHDLPEYVLEEDFDSFLVATGVLSKDDKEKSELSAISYIKNNFDFGERIYNLWKEYDECVTLEAKYVKALDKLESHLHIIERGGTGSDIKDAEHQIKYADKAVENFPELEPLLKIIKKKLRPLLEAQGLEWREEFGYCF